MKTLFLTKSPNTTNILPFALGAGLWLVTTLSAPAAFTLVDDLEALSIGPIGGQGGWVAVGSAAQQTSQVVTNDPLNINNKVMRQLGTGAAFLYNSGGPLNIPEGASGTFFLRFYTDSASNDEVFGLTDVTTPNATVGNFGDFEAQSGVLNNALRVRDAGSNQSVSSALDVGVWYNLWMVIDNSSDTWQLYIQSDNDADFLTQTQFSSTDGTINFRNGVASNPLLSFEVRNSNQGATSVYYDDLYIDATGANLANPTVPEPASTTILALGGLALLFRRRK